MHSPSVMFWGMSENKSENGFTLSNYWLNVIKAEYLELDRREKL